MNFSIKMTNVSVRNSKHRVMGKLHISTHEMRLSHGTFNSRPFMSKDQRATTYNTIGLKNCRVRASTEVTGATDVTKHGTFNY
jgi:opacity protein-like surface antigen